MEQVLWGLIILAGAAAFSWFAPLPARKAFEKTENGASFLLLKRVKKVEKEAAKLPKLLKKSRGQFPYIFISGEKMETAGKNYERVNEFVKLENEAIDAQLGIARDGEIN